MPVQIAVCRIDPLLPQQLGGFYACPSSPPQPPVCNCCKIAVSLISALCWAPERYGLISTTETLSEFLISFGPYQLYHQSAALQ
jgi:hypothetical protein